MRPLHHESRAIPVPAGDFRLAVVSDTHGRPHPDLAARVAAERPVAILHAGDVGELAVLDALAGVAPIHAVRGNVDDRASALPDGLLLSLVADGAELLRIYLTHVGIRGVRLLAPVRDRAVQEGAGLVVAGHSHVPLLTRDGGLAVFNPGSCGPRRFRLPIVFGVLAREGDGLRLHHVDCETGARWLPG
jgi:uncharacterized protein